MPLELYNMTKKSIQKLPFQLENNICSYAYENSYYLMTEIYRIKNVIFPDIMKNILFLSFKEQHVKKTVWHRYCTKLRNLKLGI